MPSHLAIQDIHLSIYEKDIQILVLRYHICERILHNLHHCGHGRSVDVSATRRLPGCLVSEQIKVNLIFFFNSGLVHLYHLDESISSFRSF